MKQEPPSTLDRQTFKHVEQFSREVCQQLATKDRAQFAQSEIIFGLAAFLAAVLTALNEQSPPQ